jgi:hypothetical protein
MKVREERKLSIRPLLRHLAATLALPLAISGCGGGGNGSAPAAINSVTTGPTVTLHSTAAVSSFAITSDDYGIENATYLAASKSLSGIVLRSAVASSMTDPAFRTVSRIDISEPAAVSSGRVYSLAGASAGSPPFAGELYFFNGHQSTLLQTVGGTITFDSVGTNPGDTIAGSFKAVVADGNDGGTPKPTYTVAGNFSFTVGTSAAILPAPTPVPPTAMALYQAQCASCHSLGFLDPSQEGAPDLSLKGGKLQETLPATAAHNGLTLVNADLTALKVLLNVN